MLFVAFVVGLAPAGAYSTSDTANPVECSEVIFIGARESGADPGWASEGGGGHGFTVWTTFERLEEGLAGERSLAQRWLDYPALGTGKIFSDVATLDDEYLSSIQAGRDQLVGYLDEVHERCHDSWIVLSGYSQGALVIRLALAELSSHPVVDSIGGIALFGDPARNKGADGLDAFGGGSGDPGVLERYVGSVASVPWGTQGLRASWCIPGDDICENNGLHSLIDDKIHGSDAPHGQYQPGGLAATAGYWLAEDILALTSRPSGDSGSPADPTTPGHPPAAPAPVMGVSQQRVGAPDGYYTANTVRFTATVTRPESSDLRAQVLNLAIRGPNDENLGRNCRVDVLILGNGGAVACDISATFVDDGEYRYWWVLKDQNGRWVRLSEERTFNLNHRAGRMGASAIRLTAPDGMYVGNEIAFQATIRRAESPWNGNAAPLTVAVRDPQGRNVDVVCAHQVTIASEASYRCRASGVFLSAGEYEYWFAWRGASGTQPWYRMSSTRTFELSYREGRMGASDVSVAAPDGFFTGNTISFSADITRGESPWNGNAAPLAVVVRGPQGQNVDVLCAQNVTIAPNGGQYSCEADGVFIADGTYTYWFAWRTASGGQWLRLSESRQFSLSHRGGHQGASNVELGAPSGLNVGDPIEFSARITRAESAWNGNAAPMIIAVRGPEGDNFDVSCAQQVTITPNGGTFVCSGTGVFDRPGTYTYWYTWRGASGDGMWFRMSTNRRFTLE